MQDDDTPTGLPNYEKRVILTIAAVAALLWGENLASTAGFSSLPTSLINGGLDRLLSPAPDKYQSAALVASHNVERAKKGLPPLRSSPSLQRAAEKHAEHMAFWAWMAHEGIGDGTPASRAKAEGYRGMGGGENIAWNSPDIPSTMRMWLNSPGHRMNILRASYGEIGAAVAYSEKKQPYWCVTFGIPAK